LRARSITIAGDNDIPALKALNGRADLAPGAVIPGGLSPNCHENVTWTLRPWIPAFAGMTLMG